MLWHQYVTIYRLFSSPILRSLYLNYFKPANFWKSWTYGLSFPMKQYNLGYRHKKWCHKIITKHKIFLNILICSNVYIISRKFEWLTFCPWNIVLFRSWICIYSSHNTQIYLIVRIFAMHYHIQITRINHFLI